MVAQPLLLRTAMASSVLATASRLGAQALKQAGQSSVRLVDHFPRELVDDIFAFALKKQTGVSLKYMLDFGSKPIERQLILSAQFLHNELPVRLSHRVAELENLPYGLSAKPHVLKVRDWYVESFRELRGFPKVKDASDELQFTRLLQHIYRRHTNVVPVMAMGVAELKRELAQSIGIDDLPDIHQFLDNFYLSRIGIRMLIGQHIALHEPPRENHIGLIDTKCSPAGVCQDAIDDARSICMREKGTAPGASGRDARAHHPLCVCMSACGTRDVSRRLCAHRTGLVQRCCLCHPNGMEPPSPWAAPPSTAARSALPRASADECLCTPALAVPAGDCVRRPLIHLPLRALPPAPHGV